MDREPTVPINDRIMATEVRVLGEDKEPLGVMSRVSVCACVCEWGGVGWGRGRGEQPADCKGWLPLPSTAATTPTHCISPPAPPQTEALELAKESDADLIMIVADASPPVCRIMEYRWVGGWG